MSKIVIDMGYKSFVLDAKQGLALLETLANAEVYESKYHGAVGDKPSFNTYHIYPLDPSVSSVSMKLLSNEAYRMYKLAGKPDNN